MADIINAMKIALGMRNPEGVDVAKLAALRSLGDINRRAYELKQQQEQQQVASGQLGLVDTAAKVLGQADPEVNHSFVGPRDSELGLPANPDQETNPTLDLKSLGIGSEYEPLITSVANSLRQTRHQKEEETRLNNESLRAYRDAQAGMIPTREDYYASIAEKNRRAPTSGSAGDVPLSPDAVLVAAYQLRVTGHMPTGLSRNKLAVAQVTNAVPLITPEQIAQLQARGLDIPANAATYLADKGSLGQMTKANDALSTAEKTVDANINQLLSILDRGNIIDTGFTPFNALLRSGAKAFGSEDQAQLDTSYAVVQPEIARILTQFNPAVGQLSDTARRDVEAAINKNATIPQMRSVLALLQIDRANRTGASRATIDAIKSRLSPGYLLPPAAGQAPAPFAPPGAAAGSPALAPGEKVMYGWVYKKNPQGGGWIKVRPAQ